jgi:uncharacterized membrane protein YfcA
MKKTKFLFNVPLTKDWLFYLFLLILLFNFSNAISRVNSSGGISTSTFGALSGILDAAFQVFAAWFPIVPIVYFIRKLFKKRSKGNKDENV